MGVLIDLGGAGFPVGDIPRQRFHSAVFHAIRL
jgi:hypothetical protein